MSYFYFIFVFLLGLITCYCGLKFIKYLKSRKLKVINFNDFLNREITNRLKNMIDYSIPDLPILSVSCSIGDLTRDSGMVYELNCGIAIFKDDENNECKNLFNYLAYGHIKDLKNRFIKENVYKSIISIDGKKLPVNVSLRLLEQNVNRETGLNYKKPYFIDIFKRED